MTLKRSTDFELVVLKKSGDSDKQNARFEVSEPEDPNSHYMSLLRKKRNAVSQYTDVTNRSKVASGSSVLKNVDASENYEKETKTETLGQQYLNWNPPHIKPADSTKGLKRLLCLAALSGLVCVLLVLTGAMILGGVNKNAQVRYQEESVKEAEIFSHMINNLTTQMRSLEETLRQTRADLVNSAALLEARQNRTDRDIESLTANTSHLRSYLSSQVETAEGNLNSRISSLNSSYTSELATTRADILRAERNYSRLNSSLDHLKSSLEMVNAFSRCSENSMHCSPEQSSNQFLYSCSTRNTAINIPGYGTLGMRCQYESVNEDYASSAVLVATTTTVRCVCKIVVLLDTGLHGNFTSTMPSGRCVLAITRCPASINVLNNTVAL